MMKAAHEFQSIDEGALREYMRGEVKSAHGQQYPYALDAQLLDVFFASTYYAQLNQDFFGAIEKEYARLEVDRKRLNAASDTNAKELAIIANKQDELRNLYNELVPKLKEDLLHAVTTAATACLLQPEAASRYESWPIEKLTEPSNAVLTYLHFGTDRLGKERKYPGFAYHAQAAIQPHLDALDKRRDLWGAFFKGLLGVIIAIGVAVPTGGFGLIPLLMSKSYRHAFFAAKTKRNIAALGDQLAAQDMSEGLGVSTGPLFTKGIKPEHMTTADLNKICGVQIAEVLSKKIMYEYIKKQGSSQEVDLHLKFAYKYLYQPYETYYRELLSRKDFPNDDPLRAQIATCRQWMSDRQADIARLMEPQTSALPPAPK